jgi:hypothetical protein
LLSESLSGLGVENIDRIFGPLGEGLETMNQKTQISTEQAILNATDGFKEAIKDLSAVLTDPLDQAAAAATAKMNAAAGRISTEAMGQLSQSSGAAIQELTDTLSDKIKGPAGLVLEALKGAVTEPLKQGDLTADSIGRKLQQIVADVRGISGLGAGTQAAVAAAPAMPASPTPAPVPESPASAPTVPSASALPGVNTRTFQQDATGAGTTRTVRIEFSDDMKRALRAFEISAGGTSKEIPLSEVSALTSGTDAP